MVLAAPAAQPALVVPAVLVVLVVPAAQPALGIPVALVDPENLRVPAAQAGSY